VKDRPFIVGGLVVFLVFVTTPVWRSLRTPKATLVAPEIKLPMQERECVAPVGYMRASHMQLLDEWRESVVRTGQRKYVAYNGKVYNKSLTETCLSACHGSRQEFCDRCHNYSGVSQLNCWNCHSDAPQVARKSP